MAKTRTQTTEAKYTPVGLEDWGYVMVMQGERKGRIGFYDDDAGAKAIVYFEVPHFGPYELIPRKYLRKATEQEDQAQELIFMNGAAVSVTSQMETPKPIDQIPMNQFPAFVAMNQGLTMPSVLGIGERGSLTRSYFENSHGEQWVASGGDKGFGLTGSDIDWSLREVLFDEKVTPLTLMADVEAGVATLKLGVLLNKEEMLWLHAFLSVLARRFYPLPLSKP